MNTKCYQYCVIFYMLSILFSITFLERNSLTFFLLEVCSKTFKYYVSLCQIFTSLYLYKLCLYIYKHKGLQIFWFMHVSFLTRFTNAFHIVTLKSFAVCKSLALLLKMLLKIWIFYSIFYLRYSLLSAMS